MRHMLNPDEALALVLAAARPLPAMELDILDAVGLTLDEEIRADRDYPPFPRAMMDGYCVHVADAGRTVPVVAEIAAGQFRDAPLDPGTAVEIMTGAPCPPGAETVVPMEDVERTEQRVRLPESVVFGMNIADTGSECRAGTVVASRGAEVTPLAIANAATFGRTTLRAIRRPICAVVATGSELVSEDSEPEYARIRDSNGPMLAAMARLAGIEDVQRRRAEDTPGALADALARTERADVVMLTGGVSVGKYDGVPGALSEYGVEIIFHKVTQKPAKPLLFGRKGARLFFALPGNPLACHLGFDRYVAPALRKMMGKNPDESVLQGRLTRSVSKKGSRTEFLLCRTERGPDGWEVTPLRGKGSADLFAPCLANSYVRLDSAGDPPSAGGPIFFTWIGARPQ